MPITFQPRLGGAYPASPQRVYFNPAQLIHPAIANTVSPAYQQVVANAHAADVAQAAARGIRPPPETAERFADIESEMRLDPFFTLARRFRVYLCGATVAAGVATFVPQRDCIPFKLVIPAGAGGTVSSLESGVDQYFAAASSIPSECFAQNALDSGWLRPLYTKVGKQITAVTTGLVTGQLALLCFDQMKEALLAPPMGDIRPIGFTATAAGAGTTTVTLAPQKTSRFRRLVIDSTGAGIAGSFVGPITVQNDPQFESNAQVPVETFFQTGLALWLDGDVASVGGLVTVAVTTPGAATIRGAVEFDTDPNS